VNHSKTKGDTDRRAADRLLIRTARRGGPWLGVLAFTATALAAAETALPATLGKTVDAVVGNGAATPWVTWLVLLIVLLVACSAIDDLAAGVANARSTAWLRHTALGHLLALAPRSAERFDSGEVASRLVANAATAARAGPDAVRTAANLIPAVGAVVALALIDPWLCLTTVAALPLLVLLLRAFLRSASNVATNYLEVQGRIAARLVEALGGARTIAAAGTADQEARRILGPLPELHRHGVAMWRLQSRIQAQNALLVPLLEVAVLAVAGFELTQGRITVGGLLAAAQYAVLATTASSPVGMLTRFAQSRAAASRVWDVLSVPVKPHGRARLSPGRGTVELRGVTVLIGDRPVLDEVDLHIPGGASVAVVGRSGAGKSTLAAVVGRLIDPHGGEVLLDGVPLPELDRSELRRQVSYGFERPALLGDTLADVIAFGVDTPSWDEIVAAASAAGADDFIRRLPRRYANPLAETPMSGGEVQRMGLARAFAHAGRVLVLDDVAASLDTVTEHRISQVLGSALKDRTRIVIAHRPSTAARADVVVWLDEGRVRMIGGHADLWRHGAYRAVFASEDRDGSLLAGVPMQGGVA
jgi:ATP-binding cassette subfamily B protein